LVYVVQPGDTLTSIAKNYGLTVDYLAGVNSIPDMDTIYAGQELQLNGVVEIPTATITDGKQIIVKLSVQRVYAFENGKLAHAPFIVSTGVTAFPTRIGEYKVWEKLEKTRMIGPGYDLPNVPYMMYFDEGRGFHGTYWHHNFGRPMSHGCVNMITAEAEWLYNFGEVGTPVSVIP
jgi:lipoprotein-anchoring transpeptidase ErfK/SrfK